MAERRKVTRRKFVSGAAVVGAAAVPGSLGTAQAAVLSGGTSVGGATSYSPTRPTTYKTHAIGYSDLDGRGGGFKLDILNAADSWYLYVGHLWDRGWTILDVTDPTRPKVANFIDGPSNTWTIQMIVLDGLMITALEKIPAGWGGDPNAPNDEGVLIWDIKDDPVHPKLLGHFRTGGTGTHRNGYWGGRYVHLTAGMPGYDGDIYVIIDIIDPSNPVEVGRWWVPGQWVAGGETGPSTGGGMHGPPFVVGNLAYLPYRAAGLIILDISDVTKPKLVGRLDYTPPFTSFGVHTVVPMADRPYAILNSEAIASRGREPLNQASVVDISDPSAPRLVSLLPLPAPPPNYPFDNFYEKGGRFGPHNQNMQYANPFVKRSDTFIPLAYFVGGLRFFDLTDPLEPKEDGYFIPPDPTHRFGPQPPDALVVQSEDVLVDTRDNIYLSNKNQGVWILRYTG